MAKVYYQGEKMVKCYQCDDYELWRMMVLTVGTNGSILYSCPDCFFNKG